MKNKTKYTKGPWKVGETIALRHAILSNENNSVAKTYGENEIEQHSNAHLIAAAPEMYNELNRMLDVIAVLSMRSDCKVYCNLQINLIKDVLKKARGES